MKNWGYPWDVAKADPSEHARKQSQKQAFEQHEEARQMISSADLQVRRQGYALQRRATAAFAETLTEEEVHTGSSNHRPIPCSFATAFTLSCPRCAYLHGLVWRVHRRSPSLRRSTQTSTQRSRINRSAC